MALPTPAADRTALVTGASSGIGADIARELARRGQGVTIVARREEPLRKLAEELHERHGVRAETLVADISDPEARHALPGRVKELGLEVDILVNNAGFSTSGRVMNSDEEQELIMVRTNIEAVVSLCSLYVPEMAERRRGAILNTASTAAFQPMPGSAAYAASKSFVLSYSESLRVELKPFGVSVTALCPGPVNTEFNDTAGITEDERQAMPKFFWVSSPAVAKAAVDGLDKGKAVVIPGAPNRISAFAAHHLPRSIVVPLVAKGSPMAKR